jgi:hypothetical protein
MASRPRQGALAGLLRLKGFAWLATQPNRQAHAALAGTQFTLSPGPPWWVSIPRAQWPEGLAEEFQAEEAAAEKAKHEMYLAEQAEQMLAAQLAAPPPAEHALYYYKRAHRAATEEANPEADPAALVQLMEERFEALTAEERAPFEEKAADEQQRTSALAAALQLAQRDATPYSPWDAEHGDRRTELVCIGRELDGEAASAQLEACLLTADEMVLLKEEGWGWLPDPFAPSWLKALGHGGAEHAHDHAHGGPADALLGGMGGEMTEANLRGVMEVASKQAAAPMPPLPPALTAPVARAAEPLTPC